MPVQRRVSSVVSHKTCVVIRIAAFYCCFSGELARHTNHSPACSHMRAVDYFTEAVLSDCYKAYLKCTDENKMPVSNLIYLICFLPSIALKCTIFTWNTYPLIPLNYHMALRLSLWNSSNMKFRLIELGFLYLYTFAKGFLNVFFYACTKKVKRTCMMTLLISITELWFTFDQSE